MPKNPRNQKTSEGLYKRKGSDKWYADLGRDARGKRDRRSTGTTDKDKAKEQLEVWLLEENLKRISPEQFGRKEPYPFVLAVKEHAEYLRRKNLKAFLNSGRYRFKLLLLYFGQIACHDITKVEIQKFVNLRLDEGMSDGTVKRDVSVLRAILNRAYDNEYIDKRPRIPNLPSTPTSERILEVGEEIKLLAVAPPHLRDIILFALETGARKGEILKLDWSNVNLKTKRIKFVNTKNGKDRIIPMTQKCRDLLFTKQRQPKGPVFTFGGQGIKDIKSSYTTAKKKAKIEGLTFHDLRHTFASRFIMNGGAQQALMTILGHSSPAMTQRYTHLSEDYLADAIEVMNKAYKFETNDLINRIS